MKKMNETVRDISFSITKMTLDMKEIKELLLDVNKQLNDMKK